jgi:predicted acyl esterase
MREAAVRGRCRTALLVLTALLVAAGLAPAAATGGGYRPPPPRYGVQEVVNFPFTMSDGTRLMGSVYYPTDLRTGARVRQRFPVLVDMTPYGMWDGNSRQPRDLADDQTLRYFTSHGYVGVEVDARGAARSGGTFAAFDPQQSRDELEVIDYVAHRLDGSNGIVGLTGMSYRGLNQLFVGGLLKPGSPVKAMAPASASAFLYDELPFPGGIPAAFWHAYAGIGAASSVPPVDQAAEPGGVDPAPTAQLARDRGPTGLYFAGVVGDAATGGPMSYRDQWWLQREPINSAQAIARAGIPVLLTSGPTDLFARGSLRMYAALQNAAQGRSVWAPMDPRLPADPRFQVVYANVYSDGNFAYWQSYELQWYDHWLKGVANGVGRGNSALHIQEFGGKSRWVDVPNSTFPMTSSYTSYYLGAAGTLATREAGAPGSDVLPWAEGTSVAYTTPSFAKGATLAGPVSLHVAARSNRPEVQLIATLNDVAPDGTVTTAVPGFEVDGILLGSQRKVDASRSWHDSRGRLTAPYHPFSAAAARVVPTGAFQDYDIELRPRLWSVQPGHSLRVVLTTQYREITPSAPQVAALAGGVYDIGYGGSTASYIDLPLLALNVFPTAGDPTTAGLG